MHSLIQHVIRYIYFKFISCTTLFNRYVAKAVFLTDLIPEQDAPPPDKNNNEDDGESSDGPKKSATLLQSHLEKETERHLDGQVDENITLEWRAIGNIIDRACFWFSFFVVIIVTPVLLGRHDDEH